MGRLRSLAAFALAAACAAPACAKPSVVLVHGILNKPFFLARIERHLEEAGYAVHNWGYPSTEKGIADLSADLAAYVAGLPAAERIDFVGFSLGTQVLRGYLSKSPPPNAGRLVMIAPPNHGSPLIGRVRGLPGVTWIFGEKAFLEMDAADGRALAALGTPRVPFGVIAGGLGDGEGLSPLIPGDDDGAVPVESTRLEGAADFILLPSQHTLLLAREETARQAAAFLAEGRFRRDEKGCVPADDEEVALFSVDAAPLPDGRWSVPLHAWIFESERDGAARAALRAAFARSQGWDGADADGRIAAFLVDNERGKTLTVTDGVVRVPVGPSGPDGHARAEAAVAASGAAWTFRVEGCPGDGRVFGGRAFLVAGRGVSVVSDVDDTIKESGVGDRRALLDNTFNRPFRAVPGMAALYRRWAAEGAAFHYLSASPWPLYRALEDFREREGFPGGSFALKPFRWKDETFFGLFQDPAAYKTPLLEALLTRYPGRTFVLVGDDGERDPEVFGDVARRHPGRVAAVYIRRAGGANAADRFTRAFSGLPAGSWTVFDRPEELAGAAPPQP